MKYKYCINYSSVTGVYNSFRYATISFESLQEMESWISTALTGSWWREYSVISLDPEPMFIRNVKNDNIS